MREPRAVLALERTRKTLTALPDRRHFAPADHMSPDGDLGTRDVAPQDIQPLVPGVERLIVRTLEARAA